MSSRSSKLVHRALDGARSQERSRYYGSGRRAVDRAERDEPPLSPTPKGQPGNVWLMAFIIGGFTTLCVLVAFHVLQPVRNGAMVESDSSNADNAFYHRTLSFDVCNGMSNQRLSLLYGVILAFELGRIPVLPGFLLSGVQWSDESTLAANNSVHMSALYDVPYFLESLDSVGVEVLDSRNAPPRSMYTVVNIDKMADPVEDLASYRSTTHLAIGCPLFRLRNYYFHGANSRIMWAVLDGMRPNKQLSKQVNTIVKKMRSYSEEKHFNFLHLRIEADWILHCKRWEHIRDGRIRNNCANNTDTIDQVLTNLGFKTSDPLYVAAFWEQVDPEQGQKTKDLLKAAGYKLYTSEDFALQLSADREVNALIDYEILLQSHKFIGNSVSTFTTLGIFQRRHHNGWSSYYNGGNIPLSDFLPMDHLPWVFTYSSFTPQYDYMVKASVKSAVRYRTLKPFCIYTGNTSAPIFTWLKDNGVSFIHHSPTWAEALWDKAKPFAKERSSTSLIYSSKESLTDDYIRIDLPLMPELEQYIYVLFTEYDIYFHRKVALSSFPLPHPDLIGMASDPVAANGVDGGVMLINLPAARDTYEEFKLFVLANRQGGYFSQGPGAVGAYMAFYEQGGKVMKLPSQFAVKPFADTDTLAAIVHFQGPKPHEYLHYHYTHECPRKLHSECDAGFTNGLCQYVKKWHTMLNETEDEVGQSLHYACTARTSDHLKTLCEKRKTIKPWY